MKTVVDTIHLGIVRISMSRIIREGEAAEPLQARFRIRPHSAAGCGVTQTNNRISAVSRDGCCTHGSCGDEQTCRAVVTIDAGRSNEQRYLSSTVSDRCVCPVFDDHDCVSEIEGYQDNVLLFSVTVHDREVLKSIVNDLRDRDAAVEIESIVPLQYGDDDVGERQIFDISTITDKQREAVEVAVKTGYYDRPRHTDLDELADRLGVSRSAASQRLNTAESKLIREFTRVTSGIEAEGTRATIQVTPSAAD